MIGLALAFAGWMVALIGFPALGNPIFSPDVSNGGTSSTEKVAHYCMGMIVMCIGCSQPLNAIARPHKGEHNRPVWQIIHKGGGWAAVIMAVVVIWLGIDLIAEVDADAFPDNRAVFSTAYGLILGLLVALGGFSYFVVPPSATAERFLNRESKLKITQLHELNPADKDGLKTTVSAGL